jgi:hypothetical protein
MPDTDDVNSEILRMDWRYLTFSAIKKYPKGNA